MPEWPSVVDGLPAGGVETIHVHVRVEGQVRLPP